MPAAKRASNAGTQRKRTRANKTSSATRKTTSYRRSLLANPIDFGRYSLPLRCKNVMRYATSTDLTLDTGGVQSVLFRANGLYDPEYAIGGHQPLYFDQMSALYNHYHVVASKIKFRVQPLVGTSFFVNCTAYIDDDAVLPGTLFAVREKPGAVNWLTSAADTDVGRTIYWNGQKTFGGNLVDNDDLKGTATSDPTELSYFCLTLTGGTATHQWRVWTEIEYTVVWSELKSLNES